MSGTDGITSAPELSPGITIKSDGTIANKNTVELWSLCKAAVDANDDPSVNEDVKLSTYQKIVSFLVDWENLDPKPDLNATLDFDRSAQRSKDDVFYRGTTILWCITYLCCAKDGRVEDTKAIFNNAQESTEIALILSAAPTHYLSRKRGISVFWHLCKLEHSHSYDLLTDQIQKWNLNDSIPNIIVTGPNNAPYEEQYSIFQIAFELESKGRPILRDFLVENWTKIQPPPTLNSYTFHSEHTFSGNTLLDYILLLEKERQLPLLEAATREWSAATHCSESIKNKIKYEIPVCAIEEFIVTLDVIDPETEEMPTDVFDKIKEALNQFNTPELQDYQVTAFQLVFAYFKSMNFDLSIEFLSQFPIEQFHKAPHLVAELMAYCNFNKDYEGAVFYAIANYLIADTPLLKDIYMEKIIFFSPLAYASETKIHHDEFKIFTKINELIESNQMILNGLPTLEDKISRLQLKIQRLVESQIEDYKRIVSERLSETPPDTTPPENITHIPTAEASISTGAVESKSEPDPIVWIKVSKSNQKTSTDAPDRPALEHKTSPEEIIAAYLRIYFKNRNKSSSKDILNDAAPSASREDSEQFNKLLANVDRTNELDCRKLADFFLTELDNAYAAQITDIKNHPYTLATIPFAPEPTYTHNFIVTALDVVRIATECKTVSDDLREDERLSAVVLHLHHASPIISRLASEVLLNMLAHHYRESEDAESKLKQWKELNDRPLGDVFDTTRCPVSPMGQRIMDFAVLFEKDRTKAFYIAQEIIVTTLRVCQLEDHALKMNYCKQLISQDIIGLAWALLRINLKEADELRLDAPLMIAIIGSLSTIPTGLTMISRVDLRRAVYYNMHLLESKNFKELNKMRAFDAMLMAYQSLSRCIIHTVITKGGSLEDLDAFNENTYELLIDQKKLASIDKESDTYNRGKIQEVEYTNMLYKTIKQCIYWPSPKPEIIGASLASELEYIEFQLPAWAARLQYKKLIKTGLFGILFGETYRTNELCKCFRLLTHSIQPPTYTTLSPVLKHPIICTQLFMSLNTCCLRFASATDELKSHFKRFLVSVEGYIPSVDEYPGLKLKLAAIHFQDKCLTSETKVEEGEESEESDWYS